VPGHPDRDAALALLHEWTRGDGLRKHALAVEAAMRAYARRLGGEEDLWGITGLLHDFDYERYPQAPDHPLKGHEALDALGYPEPLRRAILGHASATGVPRDTPMARVLFAVDELCGFLTACALVTPGRTMAEVEVPSVLRKMKSKGFARSVNRDEIVAGAAELGVPLDEHIAFVRDTLRSVAGELGL
jgi:putative nucleotidyltransferase with HDIG domain